MTHFIATTSQKNSHIIVRLCDHYHYIIIIISLCRLLIDIINLHRDYMFYAMNTY